MQRFHIFFSTFIQHLQLQVFTLPGSCMVSADSLLVTNYQVRSYNPTNYQVTPHKIPEEQRPQLHCGESITLTFAASFLISHTANIVTDMFTDAFEQEQKILLNKKEKYVLR